MASPARIVLFTPDLGFGGGIARVHEAAHRVLVEAGYDVRTVQVGSLSGPRISLLHRTAEFRMHAERDGITSVQALLPELHVTPLLSARTAMAGVLARLRPAQVVVVGAMLPYGWSVLDHGVPVTAWAATTFSREREVQWAGYGRAQAAVHRATFPAMLRAERRVMRGAARLVAMSRYGASSFAEVAERNVPVAYPPVFPPFEAATTDMVARRSALDDGQLRLVFVGRTRDPRKRFDRALTIAGEVAAESGLQVTLSVTAGASDLPSTRAGDGYRLVPLGRTTDAELAHALRAAHWALLTSDQEGFGIAIAEAMACGTPVASTPCGGPDAEIRASRGGIVAPAEEVAKRLWAATSDAAEWARMSERASSFAAGNFAPPAAAPALVEALVL